MGFPSHRSEPATAADGTSKPPLLELDRTPVHRLLGKYLILLIPKNPPFRGLSGRVCASLCMFPARSGSHPRPHLPCFLAWGPHWLTVGSPVIRSSCSDHSSWFLVLWQAGPDTPLLVSMPPAAGLPALGSPVATEVQDPTGLEIRPGRHDLAKA